MLAQTELCSHSLRIVQGVDQLSEEPVLLTVLHRYMSSGDAAASPRIAAKAKSSISAKPGGDRFVFPS